MDAEDGDKLTLLVAVIVGVWPVNVNSAVEGESVVFDPTNTDGVAPVNVMVAGDGPIDIPVVWIVAVTVYWLVELSVKDFIS